MSAMQPSSVALYLGSAANAGAASVCAIFAAYSNKPWLFVFVLIHVVSGYLLSGTADWLRSLEQGPRDELESETPPLGREARMASVREAIAEWSGAGALHRGGALCAIAGTIDDAYFTGEITAIDRAVLRDEALSRLVRIGEMPPADWN